MLGLLSPDTVAGDVVLIRQDGQIQRPFSGAAHGKTYGQGKRTAVPESQLQQRKAYAEWAAWGWPASYRKIQVHTLSSRFEEATRIVSVPLRPRSALGLPEGTLLLRRVAVGINASDVNYTSGR